MSGPEARPSVAQRAVRRLLELDRPAPNLSGPELESQIERHYRWNAACNLADGAVFWFGLSFISSATIVPLFISRLTDSTIPLGIVAMMSQGGWFLPQLFSANLTERLPRRKPVVVNLGLVLERLPMVLIGLTALLALRSLKAALVAFLLINCWRVLGAGLVGPAWQDLIARVIPVRRRGRFWGITSAVGSAAGLAGSALSAWLLESLAFPVNFAALFFLAGAMHMIGWSFLSRVREPAHPVPAVQVSQRQYLAGLPDLVRADHRFRRFLVARLLLAVATMGLGFVTASAISRWQVTAGTVGLFTAAALLGQTLGTLGFGFLADRTGHKVVLEWAAVAYLLSFLLAWLAQGVAWVFPVFVLLGIGQGAVFLSGILVVLEYSGPDRRPTYVGIANTAVGLVSMVAPLVAAWLAGIDYRLLFAVNVFVALGAWAAMRWGVEEPRS